MAIMTKEVCKTLLGITTTTYDTMITARIPAVEAYIKSYCNNDFLDDEDAEDWPNEVIFAGALMVQYDINNIVGVKSHGMEGISTAFTQDYPAQIYKMLAPHKKVQFV